MRFEGSWDPDLLAGAARLEIRRNPGHRRGFFVQVKVTALRWLPIYVMNADGTGVTRLTHNGVAEASPAWQPIPQAP